MATAMRHDPYSTSVQPQSLDTGLSTCLHACQPRSPDAHEWRVVVQSNSLLELQPLKGFYAN